MRSWVFRNRPRLAALLGRASPPPPPPARAPSASPRVVVLQPVRRGGSTR